MNDQVLTVDDLQLTLRRSARRKTLQITVERDSTLILSAPPEVEEQAPVSYTHLTLPTIYSV